MPPRPPRPLSPDPEDQYAGAGPEDYTDIGTGTPITPYYNYNRGGPVQSYQGGGDVTDDDTIPDTARQTEGVDPMAYVRQLIDYARNKFGMVQEQPAQQRPEELTERPAQVPRPDYPTVGATQRPEELTERYTEVPRPDYPEQPTEPPSRFSRMFGVGPEDVAPPATGDNVPWRARKEGLPAFISSLGTATEERMPRAFGVGPEDVAPPNEDTDRLAPIRRGTGQVLNWLMGYGADPHTSQAARDKARAENPTHDTNGITQKVFMDPATMGNNDTALSILQSHRLSHDEAQALAWAVLEHSPANVSVNTKLANAARLANEAHAHVPDNRSLRFDAVGDHVVAHVRPTFGPGETQEFSLTPDQFRMYLHGPAGQFDHKIENGVEANLNTLTTQPHGDYTTGAGAPTIATTPGQLRALDTAFGRPQAPAAAAPAAATPGQRGIRFVGSRETRPGQTVTGRRDPFAEMGSDVERIGTPGPPVRPGQIGRGSGFPEGSPEDRAYNQFPWASQARQRAAAVERFRQQDVSNELARTRVETKETPEQRMERTRYTEEQKNLRADKLANTRDFRSRVLSDNALIGAITRNQSAARGQALRDLASRRADAARRGIDFVPTEKDEAIIDDAARTAVEHDIDFTSYTPGGGLPRTAPATARTGQGRPTLDERPANPKPGDKWMEDGVKKGVDKNGVIVTFGAGG
jgi:hypothetical protein